MKHKEYLKGINDRIIYFHRQIDGTMKYPNGQVAQICQMVMKLNDAIQKDSEVTHDQ